MNVKIKIDARAKAVLSGLDSAKRSRIWNLTTSQVKKLSDEYTPFAQGTLKNTAQVIATENGGQIVYVAPYAHYQYYGMTMGANTLTDAGWRSFHAPKHYTGTALTYSGAPMRGAHWDKRMLADRKSDLEQSVTIIVKNTLLQG